MLVVAGRPEITVTSRTLPTVDPSPWIIVQLLMKFLYRLGFGKPRSIDQTELIGADIFWMIKDLHVDSDWSCVWWVWIDGVRVSLSSGVSEFGESIDLFFPSWISGRFGSGNWIFFLLLLIFFFPLQFISSCNHGLLDFFKINLPYILITRMKKTLNFL